MLRRGAGIRSLTITWPDSAPDSDDEAEYEEPSPAAVWRLQLTVASLLTALASGLRRLVHVCTCFVPWSDTMLPLAAGGVSALQALHIECCHLTTAGELPALASSLTELSLSLCGNFAEVNSLPDMPAALRKLSLLESLSIDSLLSDAGGRGTACLPSLSVPATQPPQMRDFLLPIQSTRSALLPQRPHAPHLPVGVGNECGPRGGPARQLQLAHTPGQPAP
jgi:hypothetical protein